MNNLPFTKVGFNLLKTLLSKDFKGYDPYDIKSYPFFLKLIKWGKKNKLFEIIREIILELVYHYPVFARKIFKISPDHNSKALGLIGTSSAELSLLNNIDTKLLSAVQIRIDELLNNQKTEIFDGLGWGYPFDWQSHELIPANTPNGIVTTAVGEYFWTRYRITGTSNDLKKCVRIAKFLSKLPIDEISTEKICFSYIPHYQNHVHNLNLFVADFLIKVGLETKNHTWVELGNKAVNYTISDQHENGAFDYNGPPEAPENFIDNYHTGFVLRMLGSIHFYTSRDDVEFALKKGLNFYLDNLFKKDGTPMLKPDRTYRVDIHSAAEAINCLVFLSSYNSNALPQATKVLNWTMDHLYDIEHGDFFYGLEKSRFTGRVYRSEIKYMRWSQAWMLRALSRYVLYCEQNKIIR